MSVTESLLPKIRAKSLLPKFNPAAYPSSILGYDVVYLFFPSSMNRAIYKNTYDEQRKLCSQLSYDTNKMRLYDLQGIIKIGMSFSHVDLFSGSPVPRKRPCHAVGQRTL